MINLEKLDKELDKLFENIEHIEEHHIETREARISFILNNSDNYSELDLTKMSDDEVKDIYFPLCDEVFGEDNDSEDADLVDVNLDANNIDANQDFTTGIEDESDEDEDVDDIEMSDNTQTDSDDEEEFNYPAKVNEDVNNNTYQKYLDKDGVIIYKVNLKNGKNFLSNIDKILIDNPKLDNLINNTLSHGEGIETEDGYIYWASDIFDYLKNNNKVNEDVKPAALIQLDRIKKENEKNSLGYYKTLNKGTQNMVKGKDGSSFEHDFDKNEGKKVEGNIKYEDAEERNDEYYEKAHRGMEDIKLDVPNDQYDERLKKSMHVDDYPLGKKMYDNKVKREKFIDDNDLKNTPNPGRMISVNTPSLKESISGFYFDSLRNRKVVTFLLENVEVIESISDNLKKIETQGVGNKSLNENIDNEIKVNEFFIDVANNKYYKIHKEKRKVQISESYLKDFKRLANYNSRDFINNSKNINHKLN